MKIKTERFILRWVNLNDVNKIHEILSDKETVEYLNMDLHKSVNDTKILIDDYLKGLNDGVKYPFAIIEKNTQDFIGVFLIKLDLYDEDSFESTVYINKKYWNKGIFKEILPFMIKYAFLNIKTSNFRGFVMEGNAASSKVLEKSGFKLEKIFNVPGIKCKIKSYVITKEEFDEYQVD